MEIGPQEDALEPGGETIVDVAVTDAAGNPVSGAEVALVVLPCPVEYAQHLGNIVPALLQLVVFGILYLLLLDLPADARLALLLDPGFASPAPLMPAESAARSRGWKAGPLAGPDGLAPPGAPPLVARKLPGEVLLGVASGGAMAPPEAAPAAFPWRTFCARTQECPRAIATSYATENHIAPTDRNSNRSASVRSPGGQPLESR